MPGQSNSGGSETANFCYNEQNELIWAGNSGTQPGAGTGTCGSATLQSGISGASFNKSYVYTHLGQLWQVSDNLAGSTSQYLYCNSNFPHQLQGIYAQGATCSTPGTALYTSSYKDSSNNDWGDVTSRTVGTNPIATLSYDHLDHLTVWQGGSNGSEEEWNAYDASGERVLTRSTNGSATTMTVYAFGLEEYDYDGSGNLSGSLHYYSLNGRLIGVLKQTGQTSGKDFLFEDELGSVLADVNRQSGTLVGNQLYDPYGNTRYQSGAINTSLGFTGQYGDAMTGLDYYNARWYDPTAGVFLQADTVQGNLAGMNPYAYVGGNPETLTDPTGQFHSPPPRCYCGWGGAHHAHAYNHHRQYGARRAAYREDKAYTERERALQRAADPWAHWGGIFGHISLRVVLAVTIFALNAATGVFSMVHELNTTFNGKASWGEWVKAGIGLAVNLALDFSDLWVGRAAELAFEGIGHIAEGLGHVFEGGEDFARGGEDVTRGIEDVGFCSFTPTTKVATKKGEQPIGKLHIGEKVLAYNPQTHKMEYEPILHVWIHTDNDLVNLTLTTKTHAPHSIVSTATSEVIHTNKKHPFFTEEKGFLPVAQLKLGMHVLRADGRYGVITGYRVVPGSALMYNLEVAQDHTFVVGAGEWVVHNDCGNVVKYLDRNGAERFAYVGEASAGLRNQLAPDIARIEQGSVLEQFRHDGTVFQNMEGILPDQPSGYYREWVVPTEGVNGPGAQRIITGGNPSGGRYESMYFTPWHYRLGFFKLY